MSEPRTDLDEVKRQNVAEFLERQALQRDHPERLILADALGDLLTYEHADKYEAAFGLLSRISASGVVIRMRDEAEAAAGEAAPPRLDVDALGFYDLLDVADAILTKYPPETIVCSHVERADKGARTTAAIADLIASCRAAQEKEHSAAEQSPRG